MIKQANFLKNSDHYQHRKHNKNLLMVHIIFVTKYRKSLFYHAFRCDIKQYLFETCKRYHWYLRRIETDRDHVHMLLQYNPIDCIAGIISKLNNIVHTLHGKTTMICFGRFTGKKKHCGLTVTLPHQWVLCQKM